MNTTWSLKLGLLDGLETWVIKKQQSRVKASNMWQFKSVVLNECVTRLKTENDYIILNTRIWKYNIEKGVPYTLHMPKVKEYDDV